MARSRRRVSFAVDVAMDVLRMLSPTLISAEERGGEIEARYDAAALLASNPVESVRIDDGVASFAVDVETGKARLTSATITMRVWSRPPGKRALRSATFDLIVGEGGRFEFRSIEDLAGALREVVAEAARDAKDLLLELEKRGWRRTRGRRLSPAHVSWPREYGTLTLIASITRGGDRVAVVGGDVIRLDDGKVVGRVEGRSCRTAAEFLDSVESAVAAASDEERSPLDELDGETRSALIAAVGGVEEAAAVARRRDPTDVIIDYLVEAAVGAGEAVGVG